MGGQLIPDYPVDPSTPNVLTISDTTNSEISFIEKMDFIKFCDFFLQNSSMYEIFLIL